MIIISQLSPRTYSVSCPVLSAFVFVISGIHTPTFSGRYCSSAHEPAKKLRPRVVEQLAHGHTADKRGRQDLSSNCTVLGPLTTTGTVSLSEKKPALQSGCSGLESQQCCWLVTCPQQGPFFSLDLSFPIGGESGLEQMAGSQFFF